MGLDEFTLIGRIRRIAGAARPPLILGIGDDCAALAHRPGEVSLHTTDCLVEGVHFRRQNRTAFDVGWKAVAVNLSDIAAMGGRPTGFLMTLIVPEGYRCRAPRGRGLEKYLLDLVRGAVACGRKYGAQLIGGNVSSTKGDTLIVDVSMIGAAKKGRMLTRAGARPGDVIFVTGFPGQSAAGLSILEAQNSAAVPQRGAKLRTRPPSPKGGQNSKFILAHLRPVPQLALGRLLADRRLASACIDASDGLAQDLGHICEASGVGAAIDAAKIPISPALRRHCIATGEDPLTFALAGGEDYGLLFTVRDKDRAAVRRLTAETTIAEIGRITRTRGVRIANARGIRTGGYLHR